MHKINAGGNPMYLSPEGETFRWKTDSALIASLTPPGTGYGVPQTAALQNELDTYAKVGLFAAGAPKAETVLGDRMIDTVYDVDGVVIWPS